MSIAGRYELDLKCEECGRSQTFIANTRGQAKADAKVEDWLLTRAKLAYCSSCTPRHLERPTRWKHRALDGNLMPLRRPGEIQ